MNEKRTKTVESHAIKSFRGTNLGIIRLNKLACTSDMSIEMTDGTVITPKGFDTYGHPVISETAFIYYKAKKTNAERRGESFNCIVKYIQKPFCIKREIYDSLDCLNNGSIKESLILRKQAHFCGLPLNTFLLYNKYVLASDGHVYEYNSKQYYDEDGIVEIDNINISDLKEIHIPGEDDKCAICGQNFSVIDIKSNIAENNKCEKVHRNCFDNFIHETEHHVAAQIIDSVYDARPSSQIINEGVHTWYEFKTNQGNISIRFKHKVIVLKWENNFKPFNVYKVFENERVTKNDDESCRIIHAWSKDDAIRYLSMAKKA